MDEIKQLFEAALAQEGIARKARAKADMAEQAYEDAVGIARRDEAAATNAWNAFLEALARSERGGYLDLGENIKRRAADRNRDAR